ncbi:unnamed protein product [Closterium sp. NIES-64]|nr:unnamed protein product [Closterium sp. NIES-64]
MASDSAARRSQQLAVVSASAEAAAVDIAPPSSGLASSPPAAIVVAAPAAAQPPLSEIQASRVQSPQVALIDKGSDAARPPLVNPPVTSPWARAREQVPEEDERLEPWLAHVSVLVHLATFAIIGVRPFPSLTPSPPLSVLSPPHSRAVAACARADGGARRRAQVLIRYGLEVLFGQEVAHVTDDEQTVFIDLPANIAGSFIMGMVGVAAKRHIAAYSEHLAIGLSTGLCGCITTFASWNQRMLAILASGLWVRALAGYIVGAALPFVSLMAGIDLADGIKWQIKRANDRRTAHGKPPLRAPRGDHFDRRWASLLLFFCLSVFLVTAAAIGTALDDWSSKTRRLWFACVVAAPGAWLRWYLSWLNGGAVGKGRWWQWVPVGTVAANVSASVLEAALSTVVLTYNNEVSVLAVGALQLGFLGSLSTVSTLMVEVLALHKAKTGRCWRPYFYLYCITILPSFLIGILVYCVPVWVLDYTSKYNHL